MKNEAFSYYSICSNTENETKTTWETKIPYHLDEKIFRKRFGSRFLQAELLGCKHGQLALQEHLAIMQPRQKVANRRAATVKRTTQPSHRSNSGKITNMKLNVPAGDPSLRSRDPLFYVDEPMDY